ncbi:putative cytochrome P450 [Septoria linicola]|nr:putative cytochrome P450 [Septoria linicola]
MFELLQSSLIQTAVGAILVGYVLPFLVRGYQIRKRRRQFPGPPPSWLFGDLKNVGEVAMTLPQRVHPHVYPGIMRKKFKLGNFMYLDMWPVSDPMIAIMDPAISQQFSTEYQALKHTSLPTFLEPLVGKNDMVSANGPLWKKWRSMFNPGFSTQHLITLVPGIVDDASIYVEKLTEHAQKQDLFRLEEETTRLTIDVIGKVVLDIRFNMQRGENECIDALREQVHHLPNNTMDPFTMWRPYGIYRRWRNVRIMKRYIGKVLDERFATKAAPTSKKQRKRTIIDLALDSYLTGTSDVEEATSDNEPQVMDAEFREGAITQIRVFLFAGHDTTSSTICYAYHLLRKHPKSMQRIREEHEAILGPVATTADTIKDDPNILHKLEYTLCVIKEVLRLFPAASAPRRGEKGLFLTDPKTGEKYETEGYMIWLLHYGLGHNEDVWGPTANEFVPERFLPENAAKIPEGAFRSFETGARNCLGQNLALLEARIILAMTCRQFEFDVMLDEKSLREIGKDGSFYAKDESFRKGKQDVDGEPLYQVLIGAAKPREGMPCKVRMVDWKP